MRPATLSHPIQPAKYEGLIYIGRMQVRIRRKDSQQYNEHNKIGRDGQTGR